MFALTVFSFTKTCCECTLFLFYGFYSCTCIQFRYNTRSVWLIIMYNTSSVLECKVGKSPNITQTHSKANTGQDELYWVRPLGSLQYDRRAINWLLDYCGFSLLKYICSSTPTPFMTTIKYHVYNHVFFSYYRLANGQMISAWLSCLNSVQSKTGLQMLTLVSQPDICFWY